MLLDHFFADGKPQPGAAGLGRESGFEDAGHGGGIDPVALILKVDLHESPGPAPAPQMASVPPPAWRERRSGKD